MRKNVCTLVGILKQRRHEIVPVRRVDDVDNLINDAINFGINAEWRDVKVARVKRRATNLLKNKRFNQSIPMHEYAVPLTRFLW